MQNSTLEITSVKDVTITVPYSATIGTYGAPADLIFPGGAKINGATGAVTIPEGASLDEVSFQFWKTVADVFPSIREAIIKSPSDNPTK